MRRSPFRIAVAGTHSTGKTTFLTRLKELFEQRGLGAVCGDVCRELGVGCVDDLADVDKEMLEELKRVLRICLPKGAVEEKERRERLAQYQMAPLVALVVLVKIGKV